MKNKIKNMICRFQEFSLLLGLILVFLFSSQCVFFREKRPIPANLEKEIMSLRERYPPPPDFVQCGKLRTIIKSDRGTYGGWYKSAMNPNEVATYYAKLLEKDNWTLKSSSNSIFSSGEVELATFEKEGFYISFQFNRDADLETEKIYGLNWGFRP